jgi:hypothetical protein
MPDTIDNAQEHWIILNEWEVARTLAGKKTQIRQIVKPQPEQVTSPARKSWTPDRKWLEWKGVKQTPGALAGQCPYGQSGDVLWVREAFRLAERLDETSPKEAVTEDGMAAPGAPQVRYEADCKIITGADEWGRKRPSIHMPRELCRLRLRVKDVRVERVQEISREDAIAEGVDPPPELTPKWAFGEKWNDTHGDGAWERNDWVWVIKFSRINNA